ncbi:hypothetical protein NP493_157g03004 [Ridgeia piscesae]|uniref:Methyltransferase type 11 domain-containing protein n=1 Tax=Ridgeia piscesae TaxID=27915 RepID=A0AAD9UFM7_RIDPI|nr:hypothetical protein NP493_157g03004 [Ridgeia piscesae]
MLATAAAKKIYRNCIEDYLDRHGTSIENDTYDVLVISGGMGEGHIPTIALTEMIRLVKPGGCVCIIMRQEYLTYVAEYTDRLEPCMDQLVDLGWWKREERTVVSNYAFGKPGVVFVYRVNRCGAPPVTCLTFKQ